MLNGSYDINNQPPPYSESIGERAIKKAYLVRDMFRPLFMNCTESRG